MKPYKITYNECSRTWWGEFTERNAKGERIEFAISENWADKSHPHDWLTADVYVETASGVTYKGYNPCVKPANDGGHRQVVNLEWELESTEENRQKLINEIARRAFAA